ncbi:MAG TPA: kelch repeat-containing protein [Thermoplasmata archaeon]|nr:kelch repeat-containing protein [Thermoplasmata archaeon]
MLVLILAAAAAGLTGVKDATYGRGGSQSIVEPPGPLASLWTQLAPTGGPPTARYAHTSVYDNASNRMVVYGGYDAVGEKDDAWVLENASGLGGTPAWTQLVFTGPTPDARVGHTSVYDSGSNRMVVFGGAGGSFMNDVWLLSEANGLPIPDVPAPLVAMLAFVLALLFQSVRVARERRLRWAEHHPC